MPTSPVDIDSCLASSFALQDNIAAGVCTPWHRHDRHQILYASSGTLILETIESQWWLPPQRAAFIPAGNKHQVRCTNGADLCTVYFRAPRMQQLSCGVFSVLPIAREMLLYARRWGPTRDPEDPLAGMYFTTFAALASEWIEHDVGLRLPVPASPELRRAFDYLLSNLETANLRDAAGAAQVSERTLSRRFRDETGSTLRQFIRTARVLRAIEELCIPGASVTQVAFSVGFGDVTTLSRAFRALIGQLPSDFQRVVGR